MPATPTQIELFHEQYSSAVACRDLDIDYDSFDRLEYILEQSKDEGTNFNEDIKHDPDLVKAYEYVRSKGFVWYWFSPSALTRADWGILETSGILVLVNVGFGHRFLITLITNSNGQTWAFVYKLLIQLNSIHPEVTMSIARLTPELTQILSEVQQLGHSSDNFLFWSFQIKDMPECDKDLVKVMQCGLTVLKDPEFVLWLHSSSSSVSPYCSIYSWRILGRMEDR